jgi:serine-type D-Ala-D-Ala carboxypeptidase
MIQDDTPYRPEDVGYDPSRLDAVDAHLVRIIDRGVIQSANYCLSRDGKVFAARAHGRAGYKAGDARETGPGAVQWAASITKLFTAAAIFRLVEDGIIRLGQSAGSVLEEMKVKPFDGITIAQLLSHTSGLQPDPGCFNVAYGKSARDFIRMMPDKPWLEAGLSVGMRREPGTEWMYNTFGYLILGELISRASGMDCHEYIRKEIIEPCGMADTGFLPVTPERGGADRLLALKGRMVFRGADDEKWIDALIADGRKGAAPARPLPPGTGGGLWSTAADLNRFGVMLMNLGTIDGKRVLGRRTVLRMTENYTLPEIRDWCWGAGGPHRDYALGPDRRRTAESLYSGETFYHEGVGPCALIVDPEERLVASYFTLAKEGAWVAEATYNTAAVIWSGLGRPKGGR